MAFGDIFSGTIRLTPVGEIAARYWYEIHNHVHYVDLDQFIIMPNHIHAIVIILDRLAANANHSGRGVQLNAPTTRDYHSRISPTRNSLGVIIRTYKAAVTIGCRNNGYPEFQWQRNYFEHIIRNERSLQKIREYIVANPWRWNRDKNNPDRSRNDEFGK